MFALLLLVPSGSQLWLTALVACSHLRTHSSPQFKGSSLCHAKEPSLTTLSTHLLMVDESWYSTMSKVVSCKGGDQVETYVRVHLEMCWGLGNEVLVAGRQAGRQAGRRAGSAQLKLAMLPAYLRSI